MLLLRKQKMNIYNDDCFNIFPKIKRKSIDLVLVDLPYGQTDCKWDIPIDLDKMWIALKKICKKNCMYCFFTTTKYGVALINSNPKWFRYDLVWEKSNAVGYLSANKMPLRKHEMIYVFNDNNADTEKEYNIELRTYFQNVFKFIGKSKNEINNDMGNQRAEHCFGFSNSQFGIPSEKTYNQLIKKYDINKIDNFLEYKKIKSLWDKENKLTYNPQKIKGKPYKTNGCKKNNKDVYNKTEIPLVENKGDRHPTTILKYKSESKTIHRTQKPIKLTEWLIKTYSNKNDLVMDFCMGSGTTIVACKNLERDYIGIEKDKEIYDAALNRIF